MWEQLMALGLDEKEAKFYVEALRKTHPSVTEVARSIGVNRTNAYDIVKRLVARGLLSATESSRPGSRTRVELRTTDPQYLLMEWEERRRLLDDVVPRLRAMQAKPGHGPQVRYLEGVAGIRSALFETLNWRGPLRGILSMRDLFLVPGRQAMAEYIAGRIARQLQLRVIRSWRHDTDAGWFTSQAECREARFAPENYMFTMTTIVGGDSVAFISSSAENFALIIDSTELAALHGNLFEVLWCVSQPAVEPVDPTGRASS